MRTKIGTYLLSRPQVSGKVILQNQVLVVGVSEEIAFCDWFVLVVEELESILIRKLDNWILQGSNLLEHLVRDLRVEANGTMLKLMKW